MKKRVQQFISIALAILVLCSFSYVYAADEKDKPNSKYYQDDLFQYGDSYFADDNNQWYGSSDDTVYFIPPLPDTDYKYYTLIYGNCLTNDSGEGLYCFFCNDNSLDVQGNFLIVFGSAALYKFNIHRLEWSLVNESSSGIGFYFNFESGSILDSTSRIIEYGSGGSLGAHRDYVHYNGYFFYWTAICILEKLLSYMENIYLYILSNQILQLVFLVSFVGEVIWFVVTLFNKVGELRNEEE